MFCSTSVRRTIIAAAHIALAAAFASADDHPALLDPPEHPDRKCAICGGGTGVYSDSSYFCLGRLFVQEWKCGDQRAGNPHTISCLARPSNGPHDSGYYVGGGNPCPHTADPRYCNEGTWGWDYTGCCLIPVVDLGYWHGRRDQTGNYQTDGPKICHHE